MATCVHLDTIKVLQLPDSVAGCEDCLREGDLWLHLRICLECGHVGCCDDSPNRHATAHHHSSGHPLIRSLEPGEEWSWYFVDEVGMLVPDVHGHTRIARHPCLRAEPVAIEAVVSDLDGALIDSEADYCK